ncbi:MAG: DUF308 domain-containing protein [Acidobacteriota bacterium]|jgi:uncharacterized membrane protein HdeD (DUF308 family)
MSATPDAAAAAGKNMTLYGVAAMVLGLLAMLAPIVTGLSVVLLVGAFVAVAGAARMVWALRAGSIGKGLLSLGIGVLTLLCGLALLTDPILASGLLTVALAVYLVVDGVFELAVAFRLPSGAGRGWMGFGGIISILLGIMIWSQFPLSGPLAIGILLGVKLLFVGLMMITTGSTVRAMADRP